MSEEAEYIEVTVPLPKRIYELCKSLATLYAHAHSVHEKPLESFLQSTIFDAVYLRPRPHG